MQTLLVCKRILGESPGTFQKLQSHSHMPDQGNHALWSWAGCRKSRSHSQGTTFKFNRARQLSPRQRKDQQEDQEGEGEPKLLETERLRRPEHGGKLPGVQELVGCAACQQSLPKHLLEIHEAKECQEHPVECQFCELAVRLNKVDIHEHPCGRRTEVCPDCGQRIVLHMLARHRDECCGEQTRLQKGKRIPAPESNICCHYCNQMIPGNKYFHHVDRCRPISDSVTYSPVGKPDIPPSSLSSQAAEDQTSTAEKDVRPKTKNTSRFPLLSEKSTRQAPRGTNKTTDLPLKSDGKLRGSSPVEDETAYDILRRCSQCGIVLPLPTLTQHQEKCWWLASSKGKQARSSS
ncbi:XIAP-associated factor 1 isoform X10 [Tursiops truncatus]|uniref:XIAP-associated factor 1 isoform X10 n=1 Tax=Tursiops truncatus TaxID=9739 RepID=UPI003CCF43BC